ncbi:MAG: uncharacterized protein K0Q55_1586 [Verrucomicrobia bacterium]|jgi:hypothetical protein|nr:uncharacterized protein [Verrucomicrobiota bacterium]
MKKPVKIALGLLIVLIVALVAVALSINGIVKKGVESVGPRVTKTTVRLDGIAIMPLSGGGAVNDLVIGMPEGYKSEYSIKVHKASLSISPGSLLKDKIVVKSVNVEGPEIILEGGLTANNLTQILKNVDEFTGSAENKKAEEEAPGAPKKLQVDEFVVKNAKVTVIFPMLGKPLSVTVPEIRMTGLGAGPDGITPAEMTKQVLQEVIKQTTVIVAKSVGDVGKFATDAVKDVGGTVGETGKKATEGLKGLFNKKKE